MKKFTFLLILTLASFLAVSQATYTENFDVVGSWAGSAAGSYGAKTYTNPADPVNDMFSSDLALRETTTVHSSPYGWRTRHTTNTYFRYECQETVNGFDVYMARWTTFVTIQVRYSTNSGATYTNIDTLTASYFDGNLLYKLYNYTFLSPISPESGQKVYIEFVTLASAERMHYDDFTLYYATTAVPNPVNFTAEPASPSQIDLDWQLNMAGDTVLIAYNDVSNTFGTPSGDYSVGSSIPGGGTIIYKGLGTSFDHMGLNANTTYYYKAWSRSLSGDYSPGIEENALTYKVEPSNYPTDFAAVTNGIAITLNWVDATGDQLPDAYLVMISNQDNISSPTDFLAVGNDINVSDGAGSYNVAYGAQTFTFYGLQETSTYYFKIYPYTNSGTFSDYKTDGTPPAANAVTQTIINANDFESGNFGSWTTISVASDSVWRVVTGTGAYGTTQYASINGYGALVGSNDWLISPSMNFESYSDIQLVFFNQYRFGTFTDELTLKYSTNYTSGDPTSATWTDLSFTQATTALTWVPSGFIDLSSITGTNIHIAFQYLTTVWDNTTRNWRVDEINITGTGISNPTNFIATTISSDQINLSWVKNAESQDVMVAWNLENTFGIPNGFLTEGNEISGGGTVIYRGQEQSYSHSGINPATQYYYKAWSVDESDRYSSGVTTFATTQFAEPENHPTGFTATANSFNQITVSWTDSDADHYLVKGSSVSFEAIVPPVDLVGETNSQFVKNVDASFQSAVFTGLTESTAYYFKIYPYNGSGASANYKTDGLVPESSVSTPEFYIGLIITEVADPQTPAAAKFVELMNTGTSTIDFSATTIYLSRQSNASTWGDALLTGSVAPGATYVVSSDATSFSTSYGFSANLNNGSINGNGNDGYFLYYGANHNTGLLLDAYGVINEDGIGKPWEYTDKKAVRKREIISPNATWTASEWVILPALALAKDMTPGFHQGTVTWQGTTSTNWNAKGDNWNSLNGYIPDASCNVIIPFTDIINFPIVTETSAINELQIESGSSLSIQGTGSLLIVGP